MPDTSLKQEFIQDYGEGYYHFGLPKLMGRIVGLLLYEGRPLSLDYITNELNVSKGPVSQIARRLRDHALIQRKWVPGDRKDYYEPSEDIFGKAFLNRISLMQSNLELAEKYCRKIGEIETDETLDVFKTNMEDMKRFYTLMLKHYKNFLDEWTAK